MWAKRIGMGLSLIAAFALGIALIGPTSPIPSPLQGQLRPGVLLIQQDKVIRFNTVTGEGIQVGTASGAINGVSIVNFIFSEAATGLPDITFDNRAGITDLDGDQIIFHNVGIGRFVVPPLIDKSQGATLNNQVFGATPLPCPGFGGSCSGIGGPLRGTYEVVATSGKYVSRFPIGTKYPYRGIAYNPSSPPGDPEDFGFVYVEVYDAPFR